MLDPAKIIKEMLLRPFRTIPIQELTSEIETNLCTRELGLVDESARFWLGPESLSFHTFKEGQIRRKRKGPKAKSNAYAIGLFCSNESVRNPARVGMDQVINARCASVVQFSGAVKHNGNVIDKSLNLAVVNKMGDIHNDGLMMESHILIDEVRNVLYAIEPIDGKFRDKEDGFLWRPVEASAFRIRQIPFTDTNDRQEQKRTFDELNATVYQFAVETPFYITNSCICPRTGDLLIMMEQDTGDRPQHSFVSVRVPDHIPKLNTNDATEVQSITCMSVPFLEKNPLLTRYICLRNQKENGVCWWQNGRVLIMMMREFSTSERFPKSNPLVIGLFRFRYGRGKDMPVRQVKWMRVIPVDWPCKDEHMCVWFIGRVGRSLMFQFFGNDFSELLISRVLVLTNVLHKRRQMIPTRITRDMMKLVSYREALEKTLVSGHEWVGNFVMEHMISAGGVLYATTSVYTHDDIFGVHNWARIRI